jgi:hypothetical protein
VILDSLTYNGYRSQIKDIEKIGGEGGIRTHETPVKGLTVFERDVLLKALFGSIQSVAAESVGDSSKATSDLFGSEFIKASPIEPSGL